MKSQVYKNNPQSIPELKDEIMRVIGDRTIVMPVSKILTKNVCGAARGHLADIVFRV